MSEPEAFWVEQVAMGVTENLRDRVLRPDLAPGTVRWPGFDGARAATLAAFARWPNGVLGDNGADREPLATVTVLPEACPWRPDEPQPWRLRGMATADGWRSRGVGRLAVEAAIDHVADQGATVLWCSARTPAVPFYERAGFTIEGPEFEVAGIGTHFPMARPI